MDLQLSSTLEFSTYNPQTIGLDYIETNIQVVIDDDESDMMGELKLDSIGNIEAYRFDLSFSAHQLYRRADCVSSDLAQLIEWFLGMDTEDGLPDELVYPNYLFHLQSVYIKPEYRGKDYGLFATLLFINTFAKYQIVTCNPSPIMDLKKRYSKKQGQAILRRYWSKLGLTNYDSKYNLLWEGAWEASPTLMSRLNTLSS
jgi:GNAT superfamily N-acetyltransferase